MRFAVSLPPTGSILLEEGREFGRPVRAPKSIVQAPPNAVSRPRRREKYTVGTAGSSEKMEEIFKTYRELRAETGESVDRLRLESFSRILNEKVEKIKKSKNCDKVEIRLRKDKDKTRILVRPHRVDS